MKVFYELWQMECCGTPFKVGDPVEWHAFSADILIRPFDIDGLEYVYDAHFDDWEGIFTLKGVVSGISVYYEKFETVRAPGHDRNMLKPVPGTSEIIAITSSEDVEIYRNGLQASGYIVELDEASVAPAEHRYS